MRDSPFSGGRVERETTGLKKLIGSLTFRNRPLKQKFFLFSAGVMLWFLAIFAISMAALISLESRSNKIVNYLIPFDRTNQKIIRKLQNLDIGGHDLLTARDQRDVMKITEVSDARLEDIRSFISALQRGGRVNDYSRATGKFIEGFSVRPAVSADLVFVNRLAAQTDRISAGLAVLSNLKTGALASTMPASTMLASRKGADLEGAFKNYDAAIENAVTLSNEYSARTSGIYASDSGGMRSMLLYSFPALSIVLLLATALLVTFTFSISRAVINPVRAIIGQIRALNRGEIDISNRMKVNSHDEIGRLSAEFNGLLETIDSMAKFKKMIEEDENVEDVYSRLGTEFKYFGLDEFTIYEIANSQNKMKTVFPPQGLANPMCNPDILDNCYLCRAKKTGHRISSLQYPGICKSFMDGEEKRHVCVPLMVGGTAGGVVQFIFDQSDLNEHRLSAIDGWIRAAEQYIRESIPVIEAKRLMSTLKDSALKDSLTGLNNRRFLQEYTESLVAGTLRRGKNIGLIMGDLDYFKQVNDVYGHNAGDAILKETADILRKSVRASDLVIRFGGEEFLILLMDVERDGTAGVAEKIRTTIEDAKLKVMDGNVKKTISLGISEFPVDTESFWQAIKYADVALYEAKRTGRNKTVRFAREMWKEEQF
ncbi:MAG: diguanylate cyclase [Nitrospiraceae bacterium]|nr:diguanylate cyclase [Nitrospiraceae bacterium]